MLLRQLEYLTALARERHFGRAAATCHATQPALSAGIRRLESELRVQIVQRGQRFEGFTPEGLEVLRWAQGIVAEREALDQTLTDMRGQLSGTLRLGAIPTALSVSSMLTAPLRERHAHVRYSLQSMASREIVDRLNDFELDVGMTYVDGEPLGHVRVVPLYRERYLFLTPVNGEHSGRDSLTWSEAATSQLCLLAPIMQNRRILDGYFAEAGAKASPIVECDTISAIYAHLSAMNLSSVIPHTWLHSFGVPADLRVLPLPRPRRAFHVGLVLAARDPQPMLIRALVDLVTDLDLHRQFEDVLRRHRTTAP